MPLVIIGLTGAAGSGKSTVARRLVDEWGGRRRPFAGLLKDMLKGLIEAQGGGFATACLMVDGPLKEVPTDFLGGQTPRRAMQTLGTEWGRGLAPDFWIEAWKRAIERDTLHASADGGDVMIIADDVRFPNEVAAIHALGGVVVRIERPGAGLSGTAAKHASEGQDLGEPDMLIMNNGTLDSLHVAVDRLASGLMA